MLRALTACFLLVSCESSPEPSEGSAVAVTRADAKTPADAGTPRSPHLPPVAQLASLELVVGIANESGTICRRVDTRIELDLTSGAWIAHQCMVPDRGESKLVETRGMFAATELASIATSYEQLDVSPGKGCVGNDGTPITVFVRRRQGARLRIDNDFVFDSCKADLVGDDDTLYSLVDRLRAGTKVVSLYEQSQLRHSPLLPAFADVSRIEVTMGPSVYIPHCDAVDLQMTLDLAAGTWSSLRCVTPPKRTAASGKLHPYTVSLLRNDYSFIEVEPRAGTRCTVPKPDYAMTVTVIFKSGQTVTFDNGFACKAKLVGTRLNPLADTLERFVH